ncbi:NUDIX hydrolase domain-like protein [Mycotypha africana]|uniref:NUDIX hydrolase domain-like protein n=1 Tax=Mycotypha africana TaxID=64632 RepID=UPI00230022FC|nr:NUDIX hydrolase domain-like protein [Mycotypha africana]KAI8973835.1 NUDIX hydrolase domain-like protein [Mycotypha africana]
MQYRFRIPVCGAIILNSNLDKCVLVKGWSSKSGWGFPKGKINQDEEYAACAIREVLEETGYDVGPLLKKQDYIELTMREQRIRLYIIQGVPEDTQFVPRTRKEISQISWIKLEDLPTYKASAENTKSGNYVKSGPYRFYMVVPFVNKLRQFVNQRRKALKKESKAADNINNSHAVAAALKSPVVIEGVNNNPQQQQQEMEPSNALKSLLGVQSPPTPQQQQQPKQQPIHLQQQQIPFLQATASSAPSQPHPSERPPLLNHLLGEAMNSSSSNNSMNSSDSQTNVHRASFVEELLKAQHQTLTPPPPLGSLNDNLRRNSLLNALHGNK